jgi:hypothetical protein
VIVVSTVAVVALRDRKGHRYSWLLLIAGALVSVTANAVQAAMPAGVALAPSLAAAVSAVPPIVLLASTHLTVVLARHEDQPKADAAPPVPVALPVPAPLPPASLAAPSASEKPVATPSEPSHDTAQPEEPEPAPLSDEEIRRLWDETKTPAAPAVTPPREASRTSQIEEAIRLKGQGLNNRAIGERLGVDPSTVGRWLKETRARSNTDE